MQEDFLDWLKKEGAKRGWQSDRMICKASSLSPSVISKTRTGTQPIGWEACIKIAKAFDIPIHVLLVKAGHMEAPRDDWDAETEEMVELFTRLSPKYRNEIMMLARMKNNS